MLIYIHRTRPRYPYTAVPGTCCACHSTTACDYKALRSPRAAYAARCACSGRKNSVKRKGGHDCVIVSESWRLGNAKSPATVLQEYNSDATRMSIYRVCTWYFAAFAMYTCTTYACLEACDYRAFVPRMTNRHGHWVCWTSACWMSMGRKNTESSSVEHAVQVLFLVTSVTPISTK